MNKNTIDFKKIRNHKGSQNNAFEELICQLARLSPPENAKDFIRKKGSGGDAGVECFWRLEDGSEHAWQAKYFVDKLESSQWQQISKSVTTALKKHPKLKKYYICLPLDRTDSQIKKWEEKVKEWKEIADSKRMNVGFEFWGASEILGMLSTDKPEFSGRALYWFNSPILTIQHLNNIAKSSKKSLGDRFSPEFNVELPIAKSFDGIGLTPNWHKRFNSVSREWFEALQDFKGSFNEKNVHLRTEKWNAIKVFISNLEFLLEKIANNNSLFDDVDKLKKLILDLKNIIIKINSEKTIEKFNNFFQVTNKLSNFLFSKDMLAFSKKSMLLLGGPGVGKSHLLCDITLNRLRDNLPTLFVLGQHYEGGDPLKLISDSLDLKSHADKKVLGALDTLGEAYSTRILIIIDAINEGPYKEDWKNHIIKFISKLQQYPHIAFVFSCRSTYFPYLLPKFVENFDGQQNESNLIVKIKHAGFSSIDDIYKYLDKQGVFFPNTPILDLKFSTPLFLKIYCRALKNKKENQFFQDLKSIKTIFDLYVDSISETINKNQKYRKGEKIVSKALKSFALRLFPNNLSGLQTEQARKIIQKKDPNPNTGNLFNQLMNEGILSEDIIPFQYKISKFSIDKNRKGYEEKNGCRNKPIVRFTYERFSDYFIVENLIEKEIYKKPKKLRKFINQINSFFHRILSKEYCLTNKNLKLHLKKGTPIGNMFIDDKFHNFIGIIELLSIYIGERFKLELYDLIEFKDINVSFSGKFYSKIIFLIKRVFKNKHISIDIITKRKELFTISFINTIVWRSPNSLTDRTLELLKSIPKNSFISSKWDVFLKLSINIDHPWNADFLHKKLFEQTLAERDKSWSIYLAYSYHYKKNPTIEKLIDWPCSSNLGKLESESARLYAITLLWFTSTSSREIRDKATKSAIIILLQHPELVLKLIDQFSEVNDLYVIERLYAIAYGVIVHTEDKKIIKEIAEKTYEKVFKTRKPMPHILLRDYARYILEFAYNQKLLADDIEPESFRPPYKSDWPIENPMDSEINNLLNSKKYAYIYHSLMGFSGDFGIYTMQFVHSFSPTLLSKKHPETGYEIQNKFINKLDEQEKKLCSEYIILSKKYTSFLGRINHNKELQLNTLKEKIEKKFNEEQKEYFRWAFSSTMNNGPASFSRKWAKRWVCKQAYQMGWTEELFKEFDKLLFSKDKYNKTIERIGKKYQWIAFHKLLAHLADNVHYIDRFNDENEYERPSQLLTSDIDPTFYLRKTNDSRYSKHTKNCWWQPEYTFKFPKNKIKEQEEWFELKNINIPFKNLFQVRDPKDNSGWTVLHSFSSQPKGLSTNKKENFYKPSYWFGINAIIIYKKDLTFLYKNLKNKDIRNQNIAEAGRVNRFLKEYPIFYNKYNNDWKEELSGNNVKLNINYLCPFMEYYWESGNTDYSIDETISFYLPSKTLIDKLDLHYPPGQFEHWVNKNNISIFKDPSIVSKGPSCPLVKTDVLNSWLNKENLCLVWLIGGEKRLYGKDSMKGKRHDFSGVYYFDDNNQITGDIWFLGMSEW